MDRLAFQINIPAVLVIKAKGWLKSGSLKNLFKEYMSLDFRNVPTLLHIK